MMFQQYVLLIGFLAIVVFCLCSFCGDTDDLPTYPTIAFAHAPFWCGIALENRLASLLVFPLTPFW
jgi:hypothetical protein